MPNAAVTINAPDGVADAYLTRPDDGAQRGVLFIADAFGLRPTTQEMADRIADEGYVVLAPNFFYRAGRAPVVSLGDLTDTDQRASVYQSLRPVIDELTPERLVQDGRAYLDYLSAEAPGSVAITGYCFGGRAGWRIAAAYPDRVASLAAFHSGGLVTDDRDSPHRSIGDLSAELYFGFADDDPSMTAEQIAVLEEALDAARARYRAEVYAGAHHGYTMADLPVYDEGARERHFRELSALLERTLG
jgi:carboxymethylenebutenolidase